MKLFINGKQVPVTWENNQSVQAIQEDTKKRTIYASLEKYGDFEQFGPLNHTYPSQDRRQMAESGDIMLYLSSMIVLFYGTNIWEYTKLGHIDLGPEEMKESLKNPVQIELASD